MANIQTRTISRARGVYACWPRNCYRGLRLIIQVVRYPPFLLSYGIVAKVNLIFASSFASGINLLLPRKTLTLNSFTEKIIFDICNYNYNYSHFQLPIIFYMCIFIDKTIHIIFIISNIIANHNYSNM